jgi:hypothetical protein
MTDHPLQFGMALGALLDPETGIEVTPRIRCEARLRVTDPAAFSARAAALGGDAALMAWVQNSIGSGMTDGIRRALEASKSLKKLNVGMLVPATVDAVNAELRASGASVQVGSLNVEYSPEDVARLKSASAAKATQAAAGVATVVSAGTRVIATWTDGGSYPGTIRGSSATHYEVVWDGGTASGWVPHGMVKIVNR